MPLEVDCGIARYVTEACRSDRGRLDSRVVADLAVKGALLCDLAAAGRAREAGETFEIDVPPTGCPVALEFARSIVDRIEEPRAALRHSDVGLRSMAREMVTTRRWTVRRTSLFTPRFRPVTGTESAADTEPPGSSGPREACARALARAAGLDGGSPHRPPTSVIDGCGDLAWAVRTTVDLLDDHLSWRLGTVVG